MPLSCPACHGGHIRPLQTGRRVGCAAGIVAGVVTGLRAASPAFVALPLPRLPLTPTLLAGITAGIAGGTAGAALGRLLDEHVLDNCCCLSCGFTFSAPLS